ncbi:hypothetical protein FHT86_002111 [Rhizobium sp. BK313]|nr:hypothetical protein [Rhizobium sp. BK313]
MFKEQEKATLAFLIWNILSAFSGMLQGRNNRYAPSHFGSIISV